MSNLFNSVKGLHPKRNKFSALTYRNDFTAQLGLNIPCYLQEVPPATRIKCSASALVRLQALIAPVMDNIDYYTHFWKVPYRLIENDLFTKFISGEIKGEDYNALFATPGDLAEMVFSLIIDSEVAYVEELYESIFGNGSLLDFLGYDRALFPDIKYNSDSHEWSIKENTGNYVTSLNWRSLILYYMIHLNWYMNENVEYFNNFANYVEDLVKNQNLYSLCSLLKQTAFLNIDSHANTFSMLPHAWEKDYFTSALPNVQFGDPVTLSLGGSAPVSIGTMDIMSASPTTALKFYQTGGHPSDYDGADLHIDAQGLATIQGEHGSVFVTGIHGDRVNLTNAQADLSEASAITINELRFANALQVFKERQMRFGRRRQEYYKGFFDVEPEDLRLQLPKYLGGGRIPINIADIEQTSATSGSSALGHLAGKATAVAGGFAGFSTFCSEESIIIGISFAMPHITYAQSLSRFKMKTNDIYDYFNPSFEHLGEQAIKNIEVYSGASQPDKDFGYTPRYAEYRFHLNEMHGAFKDSLSYWSLGRIFSSQPALNPQFVYMQPKAFDRIFAVSGQPNLVVSMLFHVRAIMPVSRYGTPMLLA